MEVFIGTCPGGRNAFSVAAILWTPDAIPQCVAMQTNSSNLSIAEHVLSLVGEWGNLVGFGIDAPLSWPNNDSGLRDCDLALRRWLKPNVAKRLIRSLNSRPGSQLMQGMALAMHLQTEQNKGYLPDFPVFETTSPATLHMLFPEGGKMLEDYRRTTATLPLRKEAIKNLVQALHDEGLLEPIEYPQHGNELLAIVSALTVMAEFHPTETMAAARLDPAPVQPIGPFPCLQLVA